MGTGIGLFLSWENRIASLGLEFAHWGLGKKKGNGNGIIVFKRVQSIIN